MSFGTYLSYSKSFLLGVRLARSEGYAMLDLGVTSLSPTLGVKRT